MHDPFTPERSFDFDELREAVAVAVRMLDNVLDVTEWPLPQQREEAMDKRRIGLGFTGLGDALLMLDLRYDTEDGRAMAARIAEEMRDAAYLASVDIAKDKGAFPLFDADRYLAAPRFASRLPDATCSGASAQHGIRNSHLLSIAPTGTISLAFADNASNGIEPAFSWFYTRRKRMPDDSMKEYPSRTTRIACSSTSTASTRRDARRVRRRRSAAPGRMWSTPTASATRCCRRISSPRSR